MVEPTGAPSTWADVKWAGGSLALPQLAMRKARGIPDRVLAARIVWTSYVVLHVVLGLGVAAILVGVEGEGAVDLSLAIASVVVVGGGALWSGRRVAGRPIEGPRLADGWYARYLRESAMVGVILPWAAVASVFAVSIVPYLLGLAIAAVGLVLTAPTDRRLDADAAAEPAGPGVDLVAVLRSGQDPPGRPAGGPPPERGPGPPPSKRTGGGAGGGGGGSGKKKRKR